MVRLCRGVQYATCHVSFILRCTKLFKMWIHRFHTLNGTEIGRHINDTFCSVGGTGRHMGLKIPGPYGRAGSSPALSIRV